MRRIHGSSSTIRIFSADMRSVSITDAPEIFRKSLRDFVAKELAPHVDEWEKAELFPREVFKRCGELGFLGPHYPEELGGGGGDYWYSVVWGEELVRSGCAGMNMSL